MNRARRALVAGVILALAACSTKTPPAPPAQVPIAPVPAPVPVPPPPANARAAGVALVTPRALDSSQAERALAAFRISCPALVKRSDASGLTQPSDWQPLCDQAASIAPGDAPAFFRDRFEWVRVGEGKAFATGYYEPEIAGSRTPAPGYATPVYRMPPDLIRCTRPDGGEGRGRIDENGTCVLYYTRAEIEDGALAGRGLEIAWARDPVALFFLHIQGSGRIQLPDGGVMRIGYDGQNGRDYVAIGRLLRDRGILKPGASGMKEILAWIAANPAEGAALLRENPSYIFFKELTGPGPLGALGLPVTVRTTVAADPKFIPLGAPAFLDLDRDEADGLWVAQDTGGAIKGANRFDTFWGAGPAAAATAGSMSASGIAYLLLPPGSVARAQPLP